MISLIHVELICVQFSKRRSICLTLQKFLTKCARPDSVVAERLAGLRRSWCGGPTNAPRAEASLCTGCGLLLRAIRRSGKGGLRGAVPCLRSLTRHTEERLMSASSRSLQHNLSRTEASTYWDFYRVNRCA